MMLNLLRKIINSLVWICGLFLSRISSKNKAKKICILKTDAIGDFVLFSPALEYLKEKYKKFEITLIIKNHIEDLAKIYKDIDSIITFNEKKYRRNLFYKLSFLWRIHKQRFNEFIYPVYSRERIGDEIVLWSNSKKKIGWNTNSPNMTEKEKERGDKIYTQLFNSKLGDYDHELLRNKEFLENLGIEVDKFTPKIYYGNKEKEKIEQILKIYNLNDTQIFALIPGALDRYRQWESEKWKKLMGLIINRFDNIKFIIIGSQNDKRIIDLYGSDLLLKNSINLCGKFKLKELYPLFKECSLIIGNETGPMHIAIASDVPTITILGGGHFGRFMPYGDQGKNRFVYKKMDCFNCDWKCIYSRKKCITDIKLSDVFMEVKKILSAYEIVNNENLTRK